MGTSETSASGRYLLGDSPAEIRHLVEQAEVYAREANELFDLIGVTANTTAIDIGCGVMGVLHLIAERVGEEGRVVGLDREARMVEFGRQLAEQRGLAVEFIEADATATGLPDRAFDLVHARTLLLNVEPDASAWNCDPPHPAFDILRGAILSAYRRTGKDFSIGRRIARMLRDAGLHDVQVRPTARATEAGEYYQTFLLTIAGLVRDVIVQAGELTADEFESYTAALRAHLDAPGTITCQPVMWQAWGRATPATGTD